MGGGVEGVDAYIMDEARSMIQGFEARWDNLTPELQQAFALIDPETAQRIAPEWCARAKKGRSMTDMQEAILTVMTMEKQAPTEMRKRAAKLVAKTGGVVPANLLSTVTEDGGAEEETKDRDGQAAAAILARKKTRLKTTTTVAIEISDDEGDLDVQALAANIRRCGALPRPVCLGEDDDGASMGAMPPG